MKLQYDKDFQKQLKKLRPKAAGQVYRALEQFLSEPYHPSLRNHALKGEYLGQRSISAGGDLRIHCKQINADTVLLIDVGTHSQLYG